MGLPSVIQSLFRGAYSELSNQPRLRKFLENLARNDPSSNNGFFWALSTVKITVTYPVPGVPTFTGEDLPELSLRAHFDSLTQPSPGVLQVNSKLEFPLSIDARAEFTSLNAVAYVPIDPFTANPPVLLDTAGDDISQVILLVTGPAGVSDLVMHFHNLILNPSAARS